MIPRGVLLSLQPFSVTVWGKGRLLGWTITDGMQRFPQSTWFDRSGEIQAFIKREVQLGRSGYLDKEGRELAERAAKNLRKPKQTDVDLHFSSSADRGLVHVVGRRGKRSLSYGYDAASLDDLQKNVDAILDCMARLR
jgi:hypothetical protein